MEVDRQENNTENYMGETFRCTNKKLSKGYVHARTLNRFEIDKNQPISMFKVIKNKKENNMTALEAFRQTQ